MSIDGVTGFGKRAALVFRFVSADNRVLSSGKIAWVAEGMEKT